MTLLVTIINADYNAHRVRTQHNHRRKSIKDFSQPLAANISMDDSTIGSQLERITPIPNTTEFHHEKTTERLCKYHFFNVFSLKICSLRLARSHVCQRFRYHNLELRISDALLNQ